MVMMRRVFFAMTEAAARWGYAPADIAGWACNGQLEIVTGIAPVECNGETVAGLVTISVADILPMFRRSGTGPRELPVRRIRAQGDKAWRLITSPGDGVVVSVDDMMITADEMRRFETENTIFGRVHGARGPEPKYNWDEFWRAVVVRVHEKGVPETLKEFTDEFSNWFLDQSAKGAKGDCPSDSVIRKRLSPLWHMLRQQA